MTKPRAHDSRVTAPLWRRAGAADPAPTVTKALMGPAKCSDDHFEREWRRYDIAMRQALMHACARASEAALEASCRPGRSFDWRMPPRRTKFRSTLPVERLEFLVVHAVDRICMAALDLLHAKPHEFTALY